MTKFGQLISILVIGAFAIILAGMVVLTAQRDANPVNGSLAAKLETISAENLKSTAISPADVYGEEWTGAIIACPGVTEEEISKGLGIDAKDLGIEGTIGEADNYLLVRKDNGQTYAEHLKRSEVDLCPGQDIPAFDSRQMIPLFKNEEGGWTLAV